MDIQEYSRRRIIDRPRLTRLLDDSPARIKMLVAPAGYGKSTLAQQWLESSGANVAWVTCREWSADVAVLAEGLVEVMQSKVPQWGERLLQRLHASQSPAREVEALAELARAEARAWPSHLWLAIDDYHFLSPQHAAEQLIGELAGLSNVNLIICSRTRPTWATPRRIMYGEIFEVQRSALAMTEDEARRLLSKERLGDALMLEHYGWPALLGLASLAGKALLEQKCFPDSVHDFLADELYATLSEDARRVVRVIAVAAPVARAVVSSVFADTIDVALREAVAAGIVDVSRDTVEMQPLIREFLLANAAPADVGDLESLYAALLRARSWDGAFQVVENALAERIEDLFRTALPDLLARSHVQTLEKWLRFADTGGAGVASELVRAELAFRDGQFLEAELTAATVAAALTDDDDLKTRALLVAGRAAHLASRERDALEAYRCAGEVAQSPELRADALWGEIGAAVDLELPEAQALLADAEAAAATYYDRVNLANKRLMYEARTGRLMTLDHARGLIRDLWRLNDPLLRASFLNSVASALCLTADYAECLRVCDLLSAEAEDQRLEFVFSYALSTRAICLAGVRRSDEALVAAREAHRLAAARGDKHSVLNSEAVQSRIYFSMGRYDDALDSHATDTYGAIPSMAAETAACRGLALAGLGRFDEAEEARVRAVELTRSIETRVLAAGIKALCAVGEGGTYASQALRELVDKSLDSGNLDNLLGVCRGAPYILRYGNVETIDKLRVILRKSGDQVLRETVVRLQQRQQPGMAALSPREREVGVLLARGLSNKEIGLALFISPATAKLHVRHIFEKLGVRSRTEAALRLAAMQDQSSDALE